MRRILAERYSIEAQRLGETPSVWRNDTPVVNPLEKALSPIAARATSMSWSWDVAFSPAEASSYMDGLRLVLAGGMTPEGFAASLPGAR